MQARCSGESKNQRCPVQFFDADNDMAIAKTYIYGSNAQVLVQYDGDSSADRYLYLHDRLGSPSDRRRRGG